MLALALALTPNKVCMEVVSPVLSTHVPVSDTLQEFWEAMRIQFDPQRDKSCGGHVHVTPSPAGKFSLPQLRKLAYAVVYHEDHIQAILPVERRTNGYCTPNSQSVDRHGRACGLRRLLGGGGGSSSSSSKNRSSMANVAQAILATTSERELCLFMQADRYVLWNFRNVYSTDPRRSCTGTAEFRGAAQFLSTAGTVSWVAFVLGFITLALEEVSCFFSCFPTLLKPPLV
jgi:hypothetical protein